MQFTMMVEKTIEVKSVAISAHFRHVGDGEGDDVPTDFPLLSDGTWNATIDIETGVIRDWPNGDCRDLHVKVCDQGVYKLLDESGSVIAEKDGYVPNYLVPGSYGDYIEMNIDGNGKVTNWPSSPSLEEFFDDDD